MQRTTETKANDKDQIGLQPQSGDDNDFSPHRPLIRPRSTTIVENTTADGITLASASTTKTITRRPGFMTLPPTNPARVNRTETKRTPTVATTLPAKIRPAVEVKLGNIIENDVIKKALFDRIYASRDELFTEAKLLSAQVESRFPRDIATPSKESPYTLSELEFKTVYCEEGGDEIKEELKDALEIKRDYIIAVVAIGSRPRHQKVFTEAHQKYERTLTEWGDTFLKGRISSIDFEFNLAKKQLQDKIKFLENVSEIKKLSEKMNLPEGKLQPYELKELEGQLAELQRDTTWNAQEIDLTRKELVEIEADRNNRIAALTHSVGEWVKTMHSTFDLFSSSQAVAALGEWEKERNKLKNEYSKFNQNLDKFRNHTSLKINELILEADKFRKLLDVCKKSSWTAESYQKLTDYLTCPDELHRADASGRTPEHYAFMLYDLDLIKKIRRLMKANPIKPKFNPFHKEEPTVVAPFTTFELALQKEHEDTVRILEVLKPNKAELSVLDYGPAVKTMLDLHHLRIAVESNNLTALRWLVQRQHEHGYDTNHVNDERTRELNKLLFNDLFFVACDKGFTGIVSYLFDLMKKDINVLQTALELACRNGRTDIVKVFADKGFIPDAKSDQHFQKQATFSPRNVPVILMVYPTAQKEETKLGATHDENGLEMNVVDNQQRPIVRMPQQQPVVPEPTKKEEEERLRNMKECVAAEKELEEQIKTAENVTHSYEILVKTMQDKLAKQQAELTKLKTMKAGLTPENRVSSLLRFTVTRTLSPQSQDNAPTKRLSPTTTTQRSP